MKFNFKTLALALSLAVASQTASAASYTFSGTVTDSAANPGLLGQLLVVSFSFSDTAAALAGEDGTVALDSLSLSFLGETRQLSDATDAFAQFEAGQLLGPNGAFLNLAGGDLQLLSFVGRSGFSYILNGDSSLGDLTVSAVPEPSTWALGLAGLGVVGSIARRRRQQA